MAVKDEAEHSACALTINEDGYGIKNIGGTQDIAHMKFAHVCNASYPTNNYVILYCCLLCILMAVTLFLRNPGTLSLLLGVSHA